MRIKNSIKNMFSSIIFNMVNIIAKMISRAIFIRILGSEYLGLNSLFSNVISMLCVVELGIGSSIIYNLYKPIATNNIEEQKTLMDFYKKCYRAIGGIIGIIGILIIPLLPFIVGKNNIEVNINLVYILFLISTVSSYFLSYKRNLLYANQKNYIINISHSIYLIVTNLLQVIMLILTKDYYLYLIINIVTTISENIVLTCIVNKMYSFVKEKNIKKITKRQKNDIFKRTKGLVFHKIGSFVVLGTDNILISTFFGVATVGLYANYCMVINSIKKLSNQIIQSTTASVGNLLVTPDKEKHFEVYKRILFINFWLSTFSSVALFLITKDFITIWVGKKYLLSTSVLLILVINYYLYSMRSTLNTYKEAAGIYYEDRFVPILESITNIVASIVFIKLFGLGGVFLGTIVSSLWLHCYSYPKYIYKKIFDKKYIGYFNENIGYTLLFFVTLTISYILSINFSFDNIYLEILKNTIISLIVPNIIIIIIFCKTDSFKYFYNLLKRVLLKRGVQYEKK